MRGRGEDEMESRFSGDEATTKRRRSGKEGEAPPGLTWNSFRLPQPRPPAPPHPSVPDRNLRRSASSRESLVGRQEATTRQQGHGSGRRVLF